MKVAKIVSQTKEYERLQGLIDNIETAIENIGKPRKNSEAFECGSLNMSGLVFMNGDKEIKTVDVNLNSDVFGLVSNEIEEVLFNELSNLKMQQEDLEI